MVSGRHLTGEAEFEAWKNVTQGTVVLKRLDRMGNLVDEVVSGGKVVHITPQERMFNMEQAADPDLDFFKNGILTPMRIIETAEDFEEIKNNPNHMSEGDMQELFKTKGLKAFQDKIETVNNPITLNRMIEIAKSEEVNATMRQMQILTARLEEVTPQLGRPEEVETVAAPPNKGR